LFVVNFDQTARGPAPKLTRSPPNESSGLVAEIGAGGTLRFLKQPKDYLMSNAQDYRVKSAEFARLASAATSLKHIREFRHRAQAFRSLAENEEWVVANRDKLISNRTPAHGRIGYGVAEDCS
jgi:hypothetical protein